MGLIVGPAVIQQLREFQIGQYIREEGPKGHQKKAGTPTMGGVLIAIAVVVPTLLWADLSNKFIWITVLSTLAFAAIGFADDYLKVVHHRNLGLTGSTQADVADPHQRGGGGGAGAADRQRRVFHAPDRPVLQKIPSGPGDQAR